MFNLHQTDEEEFLTVQEVARKRRVCDLTVYRKIKSGGLSRCRSAAALAHTFASRPRA